MTMAKTKTIVELEHDLKIHQARTKALQDQAMMLEQQFEKLRAKGTREIPKPVGNTYASGRIRDTASTELYRIIRDELTERPMRFREIVASTKADENKIKTVLVRMQRDEIGLVNLGDSARAVWWIPSEEMRKRLQLK